MRGSWVAAVAVGLLAMGTGPASAFLKKDTSKLAPHDIEVRAKPIASFSRGKSDAVLDDRLAWRGGLVLTSFSEYFGGWSGLRFDAGGKRFVAISDAGLWMTGELAYDQQQRPKALASTRIGPLLALNGKPLRRMRDRDAEALALASGTMSKGTAYIAFEQNDRIGIFDVTEKGLGAPRAYIQMPDEKRRMRLDGIEALTVLKGGPRKGALVAFTENPLRGDKVHRGWLWVKGVPKGFTVTGLGDFSITDAASLEDGSVLLLERRFRWLEGLRIRLRHVAADSFRAGAAVTGEVLLEADLSHEIDNLEGLAVSRGAHGETVITMISDDNFNRFLQRTVLLQFTLKERETADAKSALSDAAD
ncbi:MAG TPA: esterase-like activity of phytase family protein [Hyphomicrobium sp.]|nr:esterase-like activity of phytase family protein [Hyphomicrobium sp.]HRO51303.1 esterase-like activity of phytase family protein [Hyphomicrobium sp.]